MTKQINPLIWANMMAMPYENCLFKPPLPRPKINTKHYNRYAPCPCGSDKKFKWCCEKERGR